MTKALKRGDNQAKLVMWGVVALALIQHSMGSGGTGDGLGTGMSRLAALFRSGDSAVRNRGGH